MNADERHKMLQDSVKEIAALRARIKILEDAVDKGRGQLATENAALRAEVERLREDRQEAVKIIMAVVGNGLLKEPEFTALDKRARAYYERRLTEG